MQVTEQQVQCDPIYLKCKISYKCYIHKENIRRKFNKMYIVIMSDTGRFAIILLDTSIYVSLHFFNDDHLTLFIPELFL